MMFTSTTRDRVGAATGVAFVADEHGIDPSLRW
jgi:hypothetical protein